MNKFPNIFAMFIVFIIACAKFNNVKSVNDFLSDGCSLVINEINTGTPKVIRKKEDFIELKLICGKRQSQTKSLQEFKVIGISTANVQQMSIDLVVNLWNSRLYDRNLFTIGTELV